jgi:hypothetical protein
MLTRILVMIGLGSSSLLLAADAAKQDEPKQKVQVSDTQRADFPSGGTLRLTNSIGVLTVEAWDRPDVEITTIKSTKVELDAREREKATQKLEKVHVASERHGNELVVATSFPRNRALHPVSGAVNFDLDYLIKVPSTARIVANHHVGEVNIDGLSSDIHVRLLQGQITLHLPEENRYDINARSEFGHVNSDFPGPQKRRWWLLGHRVVNESSTATHKLNLRVLYGDVVILKTRIPKAPDSLIPAPKADGL